MNLKNKVEDIIRKHYQAQAFSGSILVRDHEQFFASGYGFANRSEQISNTERTRFGMASGCKIFAAVAICQLVEQGKLTFDTYLKDCVGVSFQQFHDDITIHQLLTHTSGAPDYFDEEIMDDFEELWVATPMYSIQCPGDFLPMFKDQPMKFNPGEKFSYSNAGFILLGLIVEQVTGTPFTQYVEENIFRVSGMDDSGYYRLDQLPARTALGYIDDEENQSWKTNIYSVPIKGGPDGGAFTTVRDLEKFWNALTQHQLMGEKVTKQMLTPHVHSNDQVYYGYGVWMLKREDKVFKYLVFGSDPGVRLRSTYYTKSKAQAHILANVDVGLLPIAKSIDEMVDSEQVRNG
ncbi:CubicO group peptidase, beta-lactamase class C family [Marininema mesophilum]|uniref:CubicO group peptidase, beta-lactamase class C family n=1 Tax=Marininema mesophilum TaxID=1048340 RepID=A0A1H3B3D0_9BACL|nr:serine hydrolase [Marininema mesophilum]SDX35914.1 CubicO group peptidase, beta-lactamase class C family [Marininema mesophilum]